MRFIVGLLLGVSLGASLGLLMAPQPGSEMRRVLRDQLRRSAAEEGEDI